mgnify:CR=1 FL=1
MPLDEHVIVSEFVKALDLIGTFVFALSGAVAGVKHRLDLFGVLVLSFVAATAGGIGKRLPERMRQELPLAAGPINQ